MKMLSKNQKPQIVGKLKKMIEEHSAVGIVNFHNLPARSLQSMKESMRGKASITMAKKSLIIRSLNESNLTALAEKIRGEPAFLFSNENPFKLYKIIKQSRSPAAAKTGEVAPNDVVIKKGATSLPPGPAITALQKVGLKTSVQAGKIAIMDDKVVVKKGETFTQDHVSVLNMLKMEPMEIGLDLTAVIEGDVIYGKDVLDIDMDTYMNNIYKAISQSVALSLDIGYITKETAPMAIRKAFLEAKTLATDANVMTKEFIDELLMKAVRQASALDRPTHEVRQATN